MPQSVDEAWDRILAWLAEHVPEAASRIGPPATAAEMAAAQDAMGVPLPADLLAWWNRASGTVDGAPGRAGDLLPGSFPYTVEQALVSRRIWLEVWYDDAITQSWWTEDDVARLQVVYLGAVEHEEGSLGPNLRAAIEDAMLAVRDHRGLMPLDEARTRLSGLSVFRKGEGTLVGGRFVLESDMTWAALVSLEDAGEFVGHARRLWWEFHVRGRDNLALTERYGDGILPWIADRVDRNGVLHNVPWCVLPCLLASEAEEAYEIAAGVRGVTESIAVGSFSPARRDVDVLCQWISRHSERGHRLLAERAATEDQIAEETIRRLHRTDPRGTTHRLTAAVGAAATEALLDRLGLVTPPLPAAMQAALDAAPQVDAPPSDPIMIAELEEHFADYP